MLRILEENIMYQSFKGGLGGIALAKHGRSRAINAENPHGEKGKGGMAASHLGPSRKGSPCLNDIEPGATVTLAEMEGPGEINHIWITVDNKTICGKSSRRFLLLWFWKRVYCKFCPNGSGAKQRI